MGRVKDYLIDLQEQEMMDELMNEIIHEGDEELYFPTPTEEDLQKMMDELEDGLYPSITDMIKIKKEMGVEL